MNRPAEEERVARLLASQTFRAKPPPADAAYWQARVRLALENEQQRRVSALRPLRMLHTGMGVVALAGAALLVSFSPAIGFYAVPATLAAVAVGAQLLAEMTPGRLR